MIAEKEILLDEVKAQLNPETGFIVTKYQNINANVLADFRKQLIKAGGNFFVMKKTIFEKAAKDLGFDFQATDIDGHLGVVSVNDNYIETTKALFAFKKEKENAIDVIGGHFEGKKCSAVDVEQISKLPTQDEMRAQLLGLLEAPMANVLGAFNAIMTSVINCMDNKAKK